MNKNVIDRLKEKAKNGYQMLRMPRCGTTLTMEVMGRVGMGFPPLQRKSLPPEGTVDTEKTPPETQFISLGSSSFADIPFSWGPDHHKVLDFPVHIDPDHPEFYTKLSS